MTVGNGALLGGGGTIDSLVTALSGGTISFGNLSDFAAGTTFDLFDFTGALTGSFGSVLTSGFGTYAGLTLTDDGFGVWTSEMLINSQVLMFTQSTGNLVITAVPEPSTWALAVMGAAAAGWLARRRGRTSWCCQRTRPPRPISPRAVFKVGGVPVKPGWSRPALRARRRHARRGTRSSDRRAGRHRSRAFPRQPQDIR